MPMLIQHIDAIARQKQRDVLYLEFHAPIPDTLRNPDLGGTEEQLQRWVDGLLDWRTLPIRQEIIAWLDARNIGWQCCGHFARTNLMMGYRGQIYIDLPYDKSLPEYAALESFLEFPDGSMRFPGALFFYCPLEEAMNNAAHDEPGFWERWAENS